VVYIIVYYISPVFACIKQTELADQRDVPDHFCRCWTAGTLDSARRPV